MLRELLRDNIDHLLLSVEKIGAAFELVRSRHIETAELLDLKRLVHSLKGNLLSIGLEDDAEAAIELENDIFRLCEGRESVFVESETIDRWFARLNAIDFSLKSYLF